MPARISLIAAIGKNRELGAKNDLLWHLPDDFSWFVNQTRGHVVIMGRKTMESLGKPLKNRRNIVITHNPNLRVEGFEFASNLDEAIAEARTGESDEIFIIGGGIIYGLALPITDSIYLTRINGVFPEADTFFPEIGSDWDLEFSEFHDIDERHQYSFQFEIWNRRR